MIVKRLIPSHAPAIADCFRRVYGESYANEVFYDVERLAEALAGGTLCSVGAVADDGRVMGHMAMTIHAGARHTELGNTVVDPAARGEGLAWRVGAGLTDWAKEKGFEGYLHYPTTDHHIMQQRSVKGGFETGLMLGYIPAETDGQVNDANNGLRAAATIVFEPLMPLRHREAGFLPSLYGELLREMANACGATRDWVGADESRIPTLSSESDLREYSKRDLVRLEVSRIGADVATVIGRFATLPHACKQVDFRLDDDAIAFGVEHARASDFVFCGWLPGFRECDVLRLQAVDERSDPAPGVVNPVGRELSARIRRELKR